jgi:hypothetical protein
MKRAILVWSTMLCFSALAGCAGAPGDSIGMGGGTNRGGTAVRVSGVVTISPLQPVAREGEPSEGPLAGAHIRVEASDGTFVRELVSDAAGRIETDLAPGTYRFIALPTSNGPLPSPPSPLEVTITAARDDLRFDYDSGIR